KDRTLERAATQSRTLIFLFDPVSFCNLRRNSRRARPRLSAFSSMAQIRLHRGARAVCRSCLLYGRACRAAALRTLAASVDVCAGDGGNDDADGCGLLIFAAPASLLARL